MEMQRIGGNESRRGHLVKVIMCGEEGRVEDRSWPLGEAQARKRSKKGRRK